MITDEPALVSCSLGPRNRPPSPGLHQNDRRCNHSHDPHDVVRLARILGFPRRNLCTRSESEG